jgi:hypothetical protein
MSNVLAATLPSEGVASRIGGELLAPLKVD